MQVLRSLSNLIRTPSPPQKLADEIYIEAARDEIRMSDPFAKFYFQNQAALPIYASKDVAYNFYLDFYLGSLLFDDRKNALIFPVQITRKGYIYDDKIWERSFPKLPLEEQKRILNRALQKLKLDQPVLTYEFDKVTGEYKPIGYEKRKMSNAIIPFSNVQATEQTEPLVQESILQNVDYSILQERNKTTNKYLQSLIDAFNKGSLTKPELIFIYNGLIQELKDRIQKGQVIFDPNAQNAIVNNNLFTNQRSVQLLNINRNALLQYMTQLGNVTPANVYEVHKTVYDYLVKREKLLDSTLPNPKKEQLMLPTILENPTVPVVYSTLVPEQFPKSGLQYKDLRWQLLEKPPKEAPVIKVSETVAANAMNIATSNTTVPSIPALPSTVPSPSVKIVVETGSKNSQKTLKVIPAKCTDKNENIIYMGDLVRIGELVGKVIDFKPQTFVDARKVRKRFYKYGECHVEIQLVNDKRILVLDTSNLEKIVSKAPVFPQTIQAPVAPVPVPVAPVVPVVPVAPVPVPVVPQTPTVPVPVPVAPVPVPVVPQTPTAPVPVPVARAVPVPVVPQTPTAPIAPMVQVVRTSRGSTGSTRARSTARTTTRKKVKKATKRTPKKASRKTPKKASRKTPKKASRKTPKKASKRTPKKTSRRTPKKTSRRTPRKASKRNARKK